MKKPPQLTAIASVAFLGFIDATYLTVKHFLGSIPPCTTSGCETVLTSPYASILGLPVALIGAIYYLLVIGMAGNILPMPPRTRRVLLQSLVSVAFLGSLGFLYLQAVVIGAYCIYCLGSLAATSTLLLLVWFSPTLRRGQ